MKKERLRKVVGRRCSRHERQDILRAWAFFMSAMGRVDPSLLKTQSSPIDQVVSFIERLNDILTRYEALTAMVQDRSLLHRLLVIQQASERLCDTLSDLGLKPTGDEQDTGARLQSVLASLEPLRRISRHVRH